MKVLVSGGGTGGHVTPTLAVAAELQRLDPSVEISYIAQKGDATIDIVKKRAPSLKRHYIRAGKLRRFNAVSKVKQLANMPMMLKNARDMGLFGIGMLQAWRIIGKVKPDVVFIKGGYVGLPVGIAAYRRGVPIVTHDSDAVPGLTNRLLSRWSTVCAVTMPVACYTYPKEKIVQTGLPISAAFAKTASAPRQSLRRELGLSAHLPVVLVAPGSSGAKVINDALMEILPKLLTAHNVSIVHIAGPKNYQAVLAAYKTSGIDMSNIVVRPFVDNLYEYSRAADIVVTRAGSMLIELAAQSCAVISIPNPYLTGGHQLRNAELYKLSKAVKVIDEQKLTADPSTLQRAIGTLLKDAAERIRLGRALHAFYQPKAAENIASLLIKVAQSRG